MEVITREYKIDLPGTDALRARLRITRGDQMPPGHGNEVTVTCILCLPAPGIDLHPQLRFDGRVFINDAALFSDWGQGLQTHAGSWRCCYRVFLAATWAEAMRDAYVWGTSEIQLLVDALVARQKALEDAEAPLEDVTAEDDDDDDDDADDDDESEDDSDALSACVVITRVDNGKVSSCNIFRGDAYEDRAAHHFRSLCAGSCNKWAGMPEEEKQHAIEYGWYVCHRDGRSTGTVINWDYVCLE